MKGAALTTYLSFPGRYMVAMPGSDSAGVSRKVENEGDRKKLKEMAVEMKIPEGFGYIMRTEALGKTKTELKKDIQSLIKLHKDIDCIILATLSPDIHFPGIPTSNIQSCEVKDVVELADKLHQTLIPLLFADFMQCRIPQLVFANLKIRHKTPIHE